MISVDPTVATAVPEAWPVKTSAMPQTTKLSASAPIRIWAGQAREMPLNH